MTTHTSDVADLPEALRPVKPVALIASIQELNAWEARADGELLTPAEGESIILVLHELKRLLALAAGQATTAQAVVPAGWKLALPGGKHTDEWESARVGDYNRGWNDYRKAAVSALSKITSEDRVRDGWAKASQWLRNNYQDHPNIASLCDAMLVAANTLTPVIERTCKAEDMPFGGCCKAPQPIPSPAPAQPVQDGERAYPPLPAPSGHIEYPSRPYESAWVSSQDAYSEEQMRAFADATYALRASHGKAPAPEDSVQEDAARYRLVRRGQHWSVIDGIGNDLRAEALDAAVDAASKQGVSHDR